MQFLTYREPKYLVAILHNYGPLTKSMMISYITCFYHVYFVFFYLIYYVAVC